MSMLFNALLLVKLDDMMKWKDTFVSIYIIIYYMCIYVYIFFYFFFVIKTLRKIIKHGLYYIWKLSFTSISIAEIYIYLF
jgi:hypothetical protein